MLVCLLYQMHVPSHVNHIHKCAYPNTYCLRFKLLWNRTKEFLNKNCASKRKKKHIIWDFVLLYCLHFCNRWREKGTRETKSSMKFKWKSFLCTIFTSIVVSYEFFHVNSSEVSNSFNILFIFRFFFSLFAHKTNLLWILLSCFICLKNVVFETTAGTGRRRETHKKKSEKTRKERRMGVCWLRKKHKIPRLLCI